MRKKCAFLVLPAAAALGAKLVSRTALLDKCGAQKKIHVEIFLIFENNAKIEKEINEEFSHSNLHRNADGQKCSMKTHCAASIFLSVKHQDSWDGAGISNSGLQLSICNTQIDESE